MDDLSIQDAELDRALDELAFINRTLCGYAPTIDGLLKVLPPDQRKFTVLDVGTGSGDTPRTLVKRMGPSGFDVRVTGIDLSRETVRKARERGKSYPNLDFQVRNLFEMNDDEQYDIVHAALVLHHFPEECAAKALAKMWKLARRGVVINDLHRHPLAWTGITLLTRLLSDNRMIRHDGPLSVLRAFTRSELYLLARRAQLPPPTITWRWPFRWQMVFRKPR